MMKSLRTGALALAVCTAPFLAIGGSALAAPVNSQTTSIKSIGAGAVTTVQHRRGGGGSARGGGWRGGGAVRGGGRWGGRGYGYGRSWRGPGIALGLAAGALAAGAAIASPYEYYDEPGYDYAPNYGYAPYGAPSGECYVDDGQGRYMSCDSIR